MSRHLAVSMTRAELVRRIAQCAARRDEAGVEREVRALLAEGVSHEEVLLEYLAPAARWLEEQWLSEQMRFAQVSFGHALLIDVVRRTRASAIADNEEGLRRMESGPADTRATNDKGATS